MTKPYQFGSPAAQLARRSARDANTDGAGPNWRHCHRRVLLRCNVQEVSLGARNARETTGSRAPPGGQRASSSSVGVGAVSGVHLPLAAERLLTATIML